MIIASARRPQLRPAEKCAGVSFPAPEENS